MQTTKAATHKGRSRVCWFTREVAGPSGFDRQPVTGPTKLQSTINRALPCVGVPNSMYSTWEACNSPCWPRSDPTHPRTSPPPITHTCTHLLDNRLHSAARGCCSCCTSPDLACG